MLQIRTESNVFQISQLKKQIIRASKSPRNPPTADKGGAEELEFCGSIEDDCWAEEGELEIGEETLDFASLVDLFTSRESNFSESFAMISCLEGPCDCLITANASATSISISS